MGSKLLDRTRPRTTKPIPSPTIEPFFSTHPGWEFGLLAPFLDGIWGW